MKKKSDICIFPVKIYKSSPSRTKAKLFCEDCHFMQFLREVIFFSCLFVSVCVIFLFFFVSPTSVSQLNKIFACRIEASISNYLLYDFKLLLKVALQFNLELLVQVELPFDLELLLEFESLI